MCNIINKLHIHLLFFILILQGFLVSTSPTARPLDSETSRFVERPRNLPRQQSTVLLVHNTINLNLWFKNICDVWLQPEEVPLEEPVLVSKYIANPLLVDGHKVREIEHYAILRFLPKITIIMRRWRVLVVVGCCLGRGACVTLTSWLMFLIFATLVRFASLRCCHVVWSTRHLFVSSRHRAIRRRQVHGRPEQSG